MKKSTKIWNRIIQLCCLCVLSLVFITSCTTKKEEKEKQEPVNQEEQSNGQEEEQKEEPLETMPEGLQELTFIDFGIENGEYSKGTYKGEYFGDTLDNTVVSGKLTFTPKGDTHVMIGGKAAWGGFGISAIVPNKSDEWVLRLYDTNGDKKGWKFDPVYFYSDVAGTQVVGKEIDLKVSIQYVDNDGDGVKNDIKLGMWFNDKLYDNQYIYLKDYTNLSYSMGTWMTVVIFQDAQLFINSGGEQ